VTGRPSAHRIPAAWCVTPDVATGPESTGNRGSPLPPRLGNSFGERASELRYELPPGRYAIVVHANGYRPVDLGMVRISATEVTVVDVTMFPE
jgi:hypothetical protein